VPIRYRLLNDHFRFSDRQISISGTYGNTEIQLRHEQAYLGVDGTVHKSRPLPKCLTMYIICIKQT